MKKLIIAAAAFISLITLSCEEDFNPKADFKQKYILWSIINSDYRYMETRQYAVLSKLYDVDGYDPSVNNEDPVLTGADVRLYADDFEYIFRQDTTRRRDTTRYNTPFIYYSTASPVKLKFGSKLRITAKLPGGEVLRSETTLPVNYGFEFSHQFENGISTLRRDEENKWTIWWQSDKSHLFFPRLRLNYTKREGDTLLNKSIFVPMRYINNEAYYGDYSVEQLVSYDFDAIDSAMAMISAGDEVKSNYQVNEFIFEMLEFDTPLSSYYSSVNGYLDNYSIRLDETVYSNISGGIGIFGSAFLLSRSFSVSAAYAKNFGYN
jgi:hypothetical protein